MFWLTFLAVAIYLIRSYLEDHLELLEALKTWTVARWLFRMMANLLALVAAWLHQSWKWRAKLVGKRARIEATSQPVSKQDRSLRRSSAQSERERVIRTYLHMLRRAAAAGVRRRQHQPPYEYAPSLHRALPETEEDIRALTGRLCPRPL